MVMKRNAMRKNLLQSIRKSFGRYIAIVAIIALGSSMFVGLLMTKSDMVETGQQYTEQHNMFDMRLISSYGWDLDHFSQIEQMGIAKDVEALLFQDLIVTVGDSTDEQVFRFFGIPEVINRIELQGGRMPEKSDECLIDGYYLGDEIIGTTVTLAKTNTEDALDSMTEETYTIVGYCATPLFMDMNRGNTSVGNGALSSYVFVQPEVFDMDYCAEIHITIDEAYPLYSDGYKDAMEALADRLEPLLEPMVEQRRLKLLEEAEEAYRDGMTEYAEGVWEFYQGKLDAQKELEDAYRQLRDAEQQILDNEALMADGEVQIAQAKSTLQQTETMLVQAKQTLESMKSLATAQLRSTRDEQAAKVAEYQKEVDALDQQIQALNEQIASKEKDLGPVKTDLDRIAKELTELEISIAAADAEIRLYTLLLEGAQAQDSELAVQLHEKISGLQTGRAADIAARDALQAERNTLSSQMEQPLKDYEALQKQKQELETKRTIRKIALDTATAALQSAQNGVDAMDSQFAPLEAEIANSEAQLVSGRYQLEQKELELAEGKIQLELAKEEIAQGWIDYASGMKTAEEELAKAQLDLMNARVELADARETIDGMTENTIFFMDRSSNIGYNSLSSSSDIVQGVSRVLPVFFLLVAAMVCITTMTRMIDEERTQIGTLKALGYSNRAIISKYMIYAGSGAVVGCGLGVLVGSMIFPVILWEAYKMLLYIPQPIALLINWPLCGAVVGTYSLVMLSVTWYCCKKALEEQPAELIRPKAPDAGKKILLEKLPFWHKISFLNKVTIRNIFRYRQRLVMMLLGIGGCTALLVTGFGLRDSIVNVVDFQFQDITVYDMSVYFNDGQSPEAQQEFRQDVRSDAENVVFYHQSSVEIDNGEMVKEIYLIAGEEEILDFIDMHKGNESIPMPGLNEMVLSVGTAEFIGVHIGDTVTLRNADLQTLELTVCGIYDNYVYNYAIIDQDTITAQWGEEPQMQMAFIKIAEGKDAHEVGAKITGMDGVMNVSVSEDLADLVGNMMQALDLVIVVVVFCAGLLAAIVLYNLTNININERIREIATIKVLGFRADETASYVFRENLSLTAAGSLFGLLLGYLLLQFVMSQIKIDMVWFKAVILPPSYIWALVLTMLSALIVDFIFYFRLDRINMAEALKSVE